jgi:tetratricopeptide (TPR) repeat protein
MPPIHRPPASGSPASSPARGLNPTAVLAAATQDIKAGRTAAAEQRLTAATAGAAAAPQILLLLGRLRRQRGETAGALAALTRLVALVPGDGVALLELGSLLAALGRLGEAERWLVRAATDRSTADRGAAARTALATFRLALATQAESAGDRVRALAYGRAALETRPDDGRTHELLARLLTQAGDMPGAAVHALAGWRAEPANPGFAANVWQLFLHMGEAGDVERLERRLADCGGEGSAAGGAGAGAGEQVVALVGLANALRRSGQAVRAERLYRTALERFPEVSFTMSRLACLCAEQNRLTEADTLFSAAAARHGGRDVITRVAPEFIAALKSGPPAAGIAPDIAEGPGVASRPLLAYVACDSRYFRLFAPTMVRSVAEDSRLDCAIVLHVVNPDAETDAAMEALAATYGRERFVLVRERVDLAPFGDQAKTWYACSRFLFLPDLLARYGRPVLMLDIDLMAIRDLNPLLATSAGADIGMMTNALKRMDVWSLLYADVVHLNPTPATLHFLDLTRRYIRHFLKPGTAHWFLDQAALAGVWLSGGCGGPAPRFAWYPTDIHSQTVMVDAQGNYWTDPHAYFYSVRATGGGQTGMDRLKRRAGTTADLR